MSTEANKAIVQRFFDEVCNGRKLDVADELFTANHIYHDPSLPGIPSGPEGMKLTVSIYQKGLPDVHWQVNEMIADGDTVMTRWTGGGTQTGELAGNPPIPPTGKQVSVEGVWTHHLAGGKIVESSNVWDTLGMLQQLGVIPTGAPA
ncbi:MAG: ester cyclase [Chloroflexi bacterium]|nr:MAG: ester cyclase [Chloroflexota bacterium]